MEQTQVLVDKTAEVAALAAETAQGVDAEQAAQEEAAGFDAVFADPPTPEQIAQQADVKAAADEQKAAEDANAAEDAKAKETETPTVIPAQITTEQLNHILSQVDAIASVRDALTKMQRDSAGRIGSLEHTIKELQAATPVGKPIVVTKEHLKRLTKEFPDVGEKLAEDLTEVLGQFKGTAEAPKVETPEEFTERVAPIVDARVNAAVLAEQKRTAPKILASRHKDYAEVIGAPGSQTEWRTWIKTQPGDYEQRMLSSWDAFELADSLDTFKAHRDAERAKQAAADKAAKDKEKKTPDVRAQRLAEAVPARGGSVVQTKAQIATEQEAFDAVFKE